AGHFLDPQRVPKDNLAALERQGAVTLIGETGPPRWSRWVLGEEGPKASRFRDGTFTISTTQFRLLELMPEMPAGGYRCHAEVRQDSRGKLGEGGVDFGPGRPRAGGLAGVTFLPG